MSMIMIPKDELEQLNKICMEQAKVIEDQRILIETMGNESLMNRGWMLHTSVLFFDLQIRHARSVMKNLLSVKVVPASSEEDKKQYEKTRAEIQQISAYAQKNLGEMKKLWGAFTMDHPAVAAFILAECTTGIHPGADQR